jgi:hypothetical protein
VDGLRGGTRGYQRWEGDAVESELKTAQETTGSQETRGAEETTLPPVERLGAPQGLGSAAQPGRRVRHV